MSNVLYDPGREGFLDGSIVMSTDTIKVILLKSSYTFSAAHKFVTDLTPASNEVSRSASGLASKTVTNGVFNAANLTFAALSGSAFSFIVLFKDTGADGTSRLIGYIDTATGLPCTPNGGDLTITWDTGANKIFKA